MTYEASPEGGVRAAGSGDHRRGDFRYQAAYANVCLDLRGGWVDDGTPIQTYTCNNNTDNMRWYHVGPV